MAKELFRNNFDEEKHFALQFAESYFADQPQEQWTLRRQQDTDHKVPEKKAKKNRDQAPPASTSSSSTNNTSEEQDNESTTTTTTTAHFENTILKELCLCLKVASFLDNPIDVQSLFCVNKAAVAIGKSPQAHPIRLQAVFGYFHVLQSYADQLAKLHYNRTELARFLTHLAVTMQTIYGPQYQVHPLHRTLVADMILKELCGVHHHGCDKQHENDNDNDDENDDDEDDNRPLFHPQATKRQLSTDLFFTKCHRFAYSVVMGDHYYSFHKSLCQEHGNGHGHGHGGVIDESIRQDVLERQGHVCVYMYQDQDNFHLVSIQKKEGDDSLYMMGTNEKDEKFKSLAHYYVLGSRSSSSSGGSYPPVVTDDGDSSDDEEEDDNMPCVDPEQIVHRLQWLCQRRLLPTTISEEDWKALLESIGRVKEDFRTDCLAKAKPLMRLHLRCSPHK